MGVIRIIIIIISVLFVSQEVHAQSDVSINGYAHMFNNNIGVYTTVFALNKDINLDSSVYFRFTVDSIQRWEGFEGGEDDHHAGKKAYKTTADAVSGASTIANSNANIDTRKEITIGFARNFNSLIEIESYYDYSIEKDYISNTPSITLKKDLFEKNTTITLSYSRNIDSVHGRFMSETKRANTDNYFFGVTQLISPVTIAQIGYTFISAKGYLAKGTRLVPINGATLASCIDKSPTCVEEIFPDSRIRRAIVLGINHYLMDRASIQFRLRYYTDTWDISSYTAELIYYKYITDKIILRLNGRYYNQTKAYFVKDTYTDADIYRSSSPQLQRFNSQLLGVKISYTLPRNFLLSGIGTESVEGKYEFYNQSINTRANIFMIGMRFLF